MIRLLCTLFPSGVVRLEIRSRGCPVVCVFFLSFSLTRDVSEFLHKSETIFLIVDMCVISNSNRGFVGSGHV